MTRLELFVRGLPAPQGSKKAFKHSKTDRIIMVESSGQKLKAWRKAVQVAIWGKTSFKGAVSVNLGFYLRRPRADFGKAGLKDNAPEDHTKRPDIDKLTRAVLDAMTDALAIEDDSYVTELHANKWWADDDETGCKIVVENYGHATDSD